MNQFIFLAIILAFQISRWLILYLNKDNTNFLWVSFFLICVPFDFGKVIGANLTNVTGTLGPLYKFTLPLGLCFFAIFKTRFSAFFSFKLNNWVTIVLILTVISIVNPYNEDYTASVAFAIYFVSNILLFKMLASFIDNQQFIKGVYDGFLILCIIQFVLAICFPVLGLTAVTELFHEGGGQAATRLGTRVGAIGLFDHPGTLSLYIVIASSFFVSTYQFNYKRKLSFTILIINAITIVLTFSRTSYLAFIIIVVLLIFVKKNSFKNLFSLANIFKFVVPITLILSWLIFLSPLGEIFLKSDSDLQYVNRTTHYKIAYHVFKASPIIGVGLNSHLTFIKSHPETVTYVISTGDKKADFFFNNPIHNIHLIVLAETGIIGFILWVLFIFRNVYFSVEEIKSRRNQILSLTFVGTIVTVCFYGMTGWSPFSIEILPIFLLIAFFSIKFRLA